MSYIQYIEGRLTGLVTFCVTLTLRRRQDTENLKRTHCITVGGGLILEKAMGPVVRQSTECMNM